MTLHRRRLGKLGEDLAAEYLHQAGYVILERNFRTPLGEIDLIARHQDRVVFVEVKTRRHQSFGTPQEAVTTQKLARLHKLASYYLKARHLGTPPVRFDVVAITWNPERPPQVLHLTGVSGP
jgi:putative endonuclease